MERHLRELAAALPVAPGDSRAGDRVVVAFDAITQRLKELSDRMNDEEDAAAVSGVAALLRQLAAHGNMVAAMGRRLAAVEALLADVCPNPPRILLALCRLTFTMQLSLQKVEERQGGAPLLSGGQLAGLLAWPAAVVAAAREVLPSVKHEVHGQVFTAAMSVTIEHLHTLAARSGNCAVHAAAQAKAHEQLPALVPAIAHAAGRLAMPGQEAFSSNGWAALLHFLTLMLDPTRGYCQAAAAALAADGPGSKPGKQLAAHLLPLLTSLAEAGPPASCYPAPAADVAGGRAAGAVASGFTTHHCWDDLLVIASSRIFEPYLTVQTARGDVGSRLLRQLGGLMERLHEQQVMQQAANAAPAALAEDAVQAQLVVAAVACTFTSRMLCSYGMVLDSLLPSAESGPPGQLQGSLAQAVEKGLQYAADALRAVPHAAMVLLAAAEVLNQTRVVEYCQGYDDAIINAGLLLRRVGHFASIKSADAQYALLAVGEATLRCAPKLQRCVLPADMHLTGSAAFCTMHIAEFCSGWKEDPGVRPAAAEVEGRLRILAALTATACKVAVLHTAATGTAMGGGPAAGAASRAADAALAPQLLNIAMDCWVLAQALVQRVAFTEHSDRLLRCVRLHGAEMAARLLPLCLQHVQDVWQQDEDLQVLAPLAQQQGEEAAASLCALAAARRYCHMGCTNLAGGSDAGLPTKRCSGCSMARFCSEECSQAAWRAGHKQVCRLLASQASMAAGDAAGNA